MKTFRTVTSLTLIALYLILTVAAKAEESTISASVDKTAATITWETDTPATSQVDYWTEDGEGGVTEEDTDYVTLHSVTITGLKPDTTYTYHVRSRNANGLTISHPRQFTTGQGIAISNVRVSAFSETSPAIAWTTDVASDSKIEYGETRTLGSEAVPSPNDYVTSHSVQLTGLTPNTLYYYRVKSVDSSGKEGISATYALSTDITSPAVSITSPDGTTPLVGSVDIIATASDNTDLDRVAIFIDSEEKISLTSSPFTYTWDTTAYDDRRYTIDVIATDTAGNANGDSVYVTVLNHPDTTPPIVNITYPSEGAQVSGVLTISAEATDDSGVVDRVVFFIDNVEAGTVTTPAHDNIYEYQWDTTLARITENRSHRLSAKVYDTAENERISVVVNIIENNPLSGLVSILGTADDPNLDYYELHYGEGPSPSAWTLIAGPFSWTVVNSLLYTWDTTGLNGTYTLRLTVVDLAGNSTQTTKVVNIVNP